MNRPLKDEQLPATSTPQPVYGGNSQGDSSKVVITPCKE